MKERWPATAFCCYLAHLGWVKTGLAVWVCSGAVALAWKVYTDSSAADLGPPGNLVGDVMVKHTLGGVR